MEISPGALSTVTACLLEGMPAEHVRDERFPRPSPGPNRCRLSDHRLAGLQAASPSFRRHGPAQRGIEGLELAQVNYARPAVLVPSTAHGMAASGGFKYTVS